LPYADNRFPEAIFCSGGFMPTQLQAARSGQLTPQMQSVAHEEDVPAEAVRTELAAGRLVIPANKLHLARDFRPTGIGRLLSTKVNANIGTSSASTSLTVELEKLKTAIQLGADTVMDLSTGGDLDSIRQSLLAQCPVPFGTVPIYEVIVGRTVEDVTGKVILDVVAKQARQGVDFFTIHAGILCEHLPLVEKRVCGIVSRGGALLAKWMIHHNRQNPLYELFDDLCDIMAQFDVCFSLGDGLRPGCIADATDEAQLAELRTLAELAERAREKGCQVMIEGPGHVPLDQIQYNMRIQQQLCRGAPFYVLGPLVTDIAPGYDHITSAIGGAVAAFYGASFLCYVTPREHLGLPSVDDVRNGLVAARIAAHAADVARGRKGAADRDRRLSLARANLDWRGHLAEAIDPATAEKMRLEACGDVEPDKLSTADYCSMCGKEWCSLRINKQIMQAKPTPSRPA
jgi:phosphomethylpyrimidine synthase